MTSTTASSLMRDVVRGSWQRRSTASLTPTSPLSGAPPGAWPQQRDAQSPVSETPQEPEAELDGRPVDKGRPSVSDGALEVVLEQRVSSAQRFRDLDVGGMQWQSYGIPAELEHLDDGTPREIRNVVVESIAQMRAAANDAAPAAPVATMSGGLGTRGRPDSVRTASIVSSTGSEHGPTSPSLHVVISGPSGVKSRSPQSLPPGHQRPQSGASAATTTGWASLASQASSHRQSVASSRSSISSGVAESTMSRPSNKARHISVAGPAAFALQVSTPDMYAGPRYVPPKLESPYAKKFKKMFKDRTGAGWVPRAPPDI